MMQNETQVAQQAIDQQAIDKAVETIKAYIIGRRKENPEIHFGINVVDSDDMFDNIVNITLSASEAEFTDFAKLITNNMPGVRQAVKKAQDDDVEINTTAGIKTFTFQFDEINTSLVPVREALQSIQTFILNLAVEDVEEEAEASDDTSLENKDEFETDTASTRAVVQPPPESDDEEQAKVTSEDLISSQTTAIGLAEMIFELNPAEDDDVRKMIALVSTIFTDSNANTFKAIHDNVQHLSTAESKSTKTWEGMHVTHSFNECMRMLQLLTVIALEANTVPKAKKNMMNAFVQAKASKSVVNGMSGKEAQKMFGKAVSEATPGFKFGGKPKTKAQVRNDIIKEIERLKDNLMNRQIVAVNV